jgi:hypothetical protein
VVHHRLVKLDTALERRHPDVRIHAHGKAVHAGCEPGCTPLDHHLCPGPPGWTPVAVDYVATCRTRGCRVEGIAFRLTAQTNADGIIRILCGLCQEWVEDLVEDAQ